MSLFWPALIFGVVYVAVGLWVLANRSRAREYVESRFRRAAPGRVSDTKSPPLWVIPVLGVSTVAVGIVAIVLGLTMG